MRLEYQETGVFLLQRLLDFFPRHWRRYRRPLARAQRINADGCLVLVVLAPIDENLAGADRLLHIRHDKLAMFVIQQTRNGVREWFGLVVSGFRVERNVDLQSLGSRGFWKTPKLKMLED